MVTSERYLALVICVSTSISTAFAPLKLDKIIPKPNNAARTTNISGLRFIFWFSNIHAKQHIFYYLLESLAKKLASLRLRLKPCQGR